MEGLALLSAAAEILKRTAEVTACPGAAGTAGEERGRARQRAEEGAVAAVAGKEPLCENNMNVIFSFLGDGYYLMASLCKMWRSAYLARNFSKRTMACESLATLMMAVEQGYAISPPTCDALARRGDLAALKWVHRTSIIPDMCWMPSTCAAAAQAGPKAIDLLSWLHTALDGPKCAMDTTTCCEAASTGNIGALQWALSNGCYTSGDTLTAAVKGRRFELLKWLSAAARIPRGDPRHDAVITLLHRCRNYPSPGAAAAAAGDMEMLQFLHDDGYCFFFVNCVSATAAAAENGHMEALQWLHGRRSPWDARVSLAAAAAGHLQLLEWATAQGCPIDPLKCAIGAARGGHAPVLEWLQQRGDGAWKADKVAKAAAEGGHLQLLVWLHGEECPLPFRLCATAAATAGHADVLAWVLQTGGKQALTSQTANAAAAGGHLHTLQWLAENACSVTTSACAHAAKGGHLRVLRWLDESKGLFSNTIFVELASSGNVAALKWARNRANGIPVDCRDDVCVAAVESGNKDMLQWCALYGCKPTARCAEIAAAHGNLEVLDRLASLNCPGMRRCASAAATAGKLHVLRYLRARGLVQSAASFSHSASVEVKSWIRGTYGEPTPNNVPTRFVHN